MSGRARGCSSLPALLGVVCLALSPTPAAPTVAPQHGWLGMQTKNFSLVGNGSEKDLRRVAQRLEQFREAIGIVLPKAVLNSPNPTLVLVFKSQKTYEPFKPVYQGKAKAIVGYFLPGPSSNFITVTTEDIEDFGLIVPRVHAPGRGQHVRVRATLVQRRARRVLHELRRQCRRPAGVARQGAGLARPSPAPAVGAARHAARGEPRLPALQREGPDGVFYAESWALVHYLLLGEERKVRSAHTAAFLGQLVQGSDPNEAATRTLQVPLATFERGLKAYVSQELFPSQSVHFTERIGAVDQLPVTPVRDADVHAALGELLFALRRQPDARAQLDAALALEPELASAHASLGRLLLAANHPDEARAPRRRPPPSQTRLVRAMGLRAAPDPSAHRRRTGR